jgi:hypothetical protein
MAQRREAVLETILDGWPTREVILFYFILFYFGDRLSTLCPRLSSATGHASDAKTALF